MRQTLQQTLLRQTVPTVIMMLGATAHAQAAMPNTAPTTMPDSVPLPSLAERGRQTLAVIERTYRPGGNADALYREAAKPGDPAFRSGASFAWAGGVQLSALVAAARIDPGRYRDPMQRYINALDAHWFIDAHHLGGYCAGAHPQSADRYYDDNAWLLIDFCDAYELTHDRTTLDRARATMRFIQSGEDSALGGGLYWHEQKRASKNTCSNAPSIVGALRLYGLTHEKAYLDAAQRWYAWTQAHLQDPKDGLYFDNVKLNGNIERTKWSYNTALMIQAACLFYDQSHDPTDLATAQRLAKAAESQWLTADGRLKGPGYFAHLLAAAWLMVGERTNDPHWRQCVTRAAEALWQTCRDPAGHFLEHWDATAKGPMKKTDPMKKTELIWDASAARLFFDAAHAESAHR